MTTMHGGRATTTSVDDSMQAALALHRQGDLDGAERAYRRVVNAAPGHADAWHMLGVALLQGGKAGPAVSAMQKALELQPRTALVACNLASALLQLGEHRDAIDLLDKALTLDPSLQLARRNRALALEGAGRSDEALSEWRNCLRQDPDDIEALRRTARLELRRGNPSEAHDAMQAVVRLAPRDAFARNLMGVALLELGRFQPALEQLTLALQLDPDSAAAWVNHGNALHKLGSFETAEASYARALQLDPSLAIAWANRATVRVELRRFRDALADADHALSLGPPAPAALNARGAALLGLHRPAEALRAFDAALELGPDQALTRANRASALIGLRRFAAALDDARRALVLEPGHRRAALCEVGALLELEQVEAALERLTLRLTENPDDTDALYLQTGIFTTLRRYSDAHQASEQALLLAPDDPTAWSSHAALLLHEELHEPSVAANERALELGEPSASLLNNLATAYGMLQRHSDAAVTLDRLLQLDADFPCALGGRLSQRLHDCDWRDYAGEVARIEQALRAGVRADDPFNTLRLPLGADVLLACAEATAREGFPARAPLWNGERYQHERVRVAYLSADFHAHATAYLMAGLFERHDRAEFEVFGISYGPATEDSMRDRLRNGLENFIDVSMQSDLAIAQKLRELEIDIAVDLKGYTRHGRLGILSHRPAPVQATYLGFPGTLGAGFIDYVLADQTVIPPDDAATFTERVAYLPYCYQVTDDRREVGSITPSRADCGLPQTGFVFCCMNAVVKIAPAVFDVWMDLLRAVEGSVLWLFDSHAAATRNLRAEAAARGIDPLRLVFAPRMPQAEHLARYRVADLFLDTLPYNAHTTASDALWAGLPVLTCRGDTFAARVGASIVAAAGLEELVTTSLVDYRTMAIALARDPARLARIRQKLAANLRTLPLFDTDAFRQHLEAAFREMHARCQRGEPPVSFTVGATATAVAGRMPPCGIPTVS